MAVCGLRRSLWFSYNVKRRARALTAYVQLYACLIFFQQRAGLLGYSTCLCQRRDMFL